MKRLLITLMIILTGMFVHSRQVHAISTSYDCRYVDDNEPIVPAGSHRLKIVQGRDFKCKLKCNGHTEDDFWLKDIDQEKNGQRNTCTSLSGTPPSATCNFNILTEDNNLNFIEVTATSPSENCETQKIYYQVVTSDEMPIAECAI